VKPCRGVGKIPVNPDIVLAKKSDDDVLRPYRAYRVKNILPRVPQSLHPGSLSDLKAELNGSLLI